MSAVLMGFEVAGPQIISFALGALTIGGAAIGIYDKRKRELTQTYKDLYDAKKQEVGELTDKVRRLESQVELMMSDFTKKLAEGITEAIISIYESKMGEGQEEH